MTWVVIALVFIDVAALSIGISIRRKVTRIITKTATEIEVAVKAGIADAVAQFVTMATALLSARGDQPVPGGLLEKLEELTAGFRG